MLRVNVKTVNVNTCVRQIVTYILSQLFVRMRPCLYVWIVDYPTITTFYSCNAGSSVDFPMVRYVVFSFKLALIYVCMNTAKLWAMKLSCNKEDYIISPRNMSLTKQ